ncbi:hypothetical protein HDU85_000812 [Gaertneriomyces sp. JEL0708]|nr:hypothetical protein HDU85_000812 [Gaertneriomyces sp. JEL0708]
MFAYRDRIRKASALTSRWTAAQRQRILQTPEIKELLATLQLDVTKRIFVSTAIARDVRLDPVIPTGISTRHLERLQKWMVPTAEALARSFVDAFIMEAAEHSYTAAGPLNFFGSVHVSETQPETRTVLSGDVDYCYAYGESESVTIENICLIIEAKKRSESPSSGKILQLLTYMAIVHRARKAAGKANPGVLGVTTTGFLWSSAASTMTGEKVAVLRHLKFYLKACQFASPATTTFASADDLAQDSLAVNINHHLTGYEVSTRNQEEQPSNSDMENFNLEVVGEEDHDSD